MNSNMGCIDTSVAIVFVLFIVMMNSNMGCIDTQKIPTSNDKYVLDEQ